MYKSVIKCDTCHIAVECDPDEGPPAGWYLLVEMDEACSWTEECHFCSAPCVRVPR